MSEILITKQTAALRLIKGAVHNFNSEASDPLVVHCLAASALRVLRDLLSKRGTTFGGQAFAATIFDLAQAQAQGTSPTVNVPVKDALQPIVSHFAEEIRCGRVEASADIDVDWPLEFDIEHFAPITSAHNFLKHGDRDAHGAMEESSKDALDALIYSITAFAMLFPNVELDDDVGMFVRAVLDRRDHHSGDNPA